MKRLPALVLILVAAACQQKAAAPALQARASEAPPALPAGHPPIAKSAAAADPGLSLSGTVSAAPLIAAKLGAAKQTSLFLIARDAGTQQIVAVRKEEGVSFPFAFTLSGADSMLQGTAFTGTLDLTARVSKSGDAMPAAGDVEGVTKGVRVGARDVAVTLDRVRP
jgi:cytochrome c-type biogenesis protein CcmH